MRFFTFATAALSSSLTTARIIGIAAPSTIAPNGTFALTLLTENYIQSVADIAVAYGFSLPSTAFPTTLGQYTGSAYLGPEKSNTLSNVTVEAKVSDALEDDFWMGKDVVLSAGVYSLYGASGSATVTGFNVTVKIGTCTSDDLVRSQEQSWIENTAS